MAVTLDQVRDQLGMGSAPDVGRTSSSVTDDQLQPYLDAALAVCADRCGPVVTTGPITETHDGGWPTIIVRQTPIASVISVVEYVGLSTWTLTAQPLGQTVDNYGYSLDDLNAGIITRRSAAGTPMQFLGGRRSIVVTYTAGFASIPADLAQGLLILTQHLYGSRVGTSSQRPGAASAGAPTTFAVPNRVMELWRPYLTVPGIA